MMLYDYYEKLEREDYLKLIHTFSYQAKIRILWDDSHDTTIIIDQQGNRA